ncbi:MAG TPA: molybdate ABC transporter substrate-binding protein [Candidatus Didemnitutus sp.]|nr:molybdate ABC transporter substrate-binding protein [Candidatus Didemnitutus sp.]
MIKTVFVTFALVAVAASAADLTVFAAASLTDVLQPVANAYHTRNPADTVHFNFAASSTLARQITEGAPADIFFSADEAKMDGLEKGGLILAGTRRRLLGNSLVVVVPADTTRAISAPDDLAGPSIRHLALAETKTVPAGIYARAWLEKSGLWDKIADRIVTTENVRACLAAVESGNADAAIVYQTDARISHRARVAFAITGPRAPDISYPVAVVRNSKQEADARQFADFLAGAEAKALFEHAGFEVFR